MSGVAVRCVLFRAAGERFALPLEAVREVVLPQPPFARVPRSGPAVRGAMNLRGRVVPVVDLAALLDLPAPPLGEREGQVIVLEGPRPGLGVWVAAVLGVEVLLPEEGRGDAAGPAGRVTCGVAAAKSGAATLLDARALAALAEAHFGAR